MNELFLSFIFNALLGVVMFFLKQNNDTLKERLKDVETRTSKIEETTVKKEDFREFKEELWLRLDKMENTFERRLREAVKN
jgi:hypothetical protein